MSEYEQAEVLFPDQDIVISTQPPCSTPTYTQYNLIPNIKTCPDVPPDYSICKLYLLYY
jgi:hypothetical protein